MSLKASTREQVFNKFGGRCAYCGTKIERVGRNAFQVDHIDAKVYGGSNHHNNLNPACRPCNNFKTVWSIEEFRTEIGYQIERARRYSVNFRMAEKFGLLYVTENKVVFHFERVLSKEGEGE